MLKTSLYNTLKNKKAYFNDILLEVISIGKRYSFELHSCVMSSNRLEMKLYSCSNDNNTVKLTMNTSDFGIVIKCDDIKFYANVVTDMLSDITDSIDLNSY